MVSQPVRTKDGKNFRWRYHELKTLISMIFLYTNYCMSHVYRQKWGRGVGHSHWEVLKFLSLLFHQWTEVNFYMYKEFTILELVSNPFVYIIYNKICSNQIINYFSSSWPKHTKLTPGGEIHCIDLLVYHLNKLDLIILLNIISLQYWILILHKLI